MHILHGLCQRNGAAPAGWLALSSFLVTIYKHLRYDTNIESPITKVWLDVIGVLYVDDTDLYIMDESIRSDYDLWQETQGAITSWGKLLLSTGGALKPEKYFYYMVDYEWQDDGSWEYSRWVFIPSQAF